MKEKKVLIVVGTRPNFIKITQFEKYFSNFPHIDFKIVHTGQHFDYNMSDVFFSQLNIRKPDFFLGIPAGSPTFQMGMIMIELEKVFDNYLPDLVVVVGDVNSTFAAAFAAYKKGIKIAHLESGLRSNDREMPEEINRILTDEISNYFFITEQSGYDNLIEEGKQPNQLFFVGNTMIDTLAAFQPQIDMSDILEQLQISDSKYCLVTIHRPSNVDEIENLTYTLHILHQVSEKIKIVFSVHPRTIQKAEKYDLKKKLDENKNIIITPPLDYFAFQKLVKNAAFVLTDSGGIQEETTFQKIPCLTLRKNTERPSTISIGTNQLLDFDAKTILQKVDEILNGNHKKGQIPPFWDGLATKRIVEIIDSL